MDEIKELLDNEIKIRKANIEELGKIFIADEIKANRTVDIKEELEKISQMNQNEEVWKQEMNELLTGDDENLKFLPSERYNYLARNEDFIKSKAENFVESLNKVSDIENTETKLNLLDIIKDSYENFVKNIKIIDENKLTIEEKSLIDLIQFDEEMSGGTTIEEKKETFRTSIGTDYSKEAYNDIVRRSKVIEDAKDKINNFKTFLKRAISNEVKTEEAERKLNQQFNKMINKNTNNINMVQNQQTNNDSARQVQQARQKYGIFNKCMEAFQNKRDSRIL